MSGRSSRKDLNVRIRQGNPVKGILAEAAGDGSDLIVLGCEQDPTCYWEQWGNVPQKDGRVGRLPGLGHQKRAGHPKNSLLPGSRPGQPGIAGNGQPDGNSSPGRNWKSWD